MIRLAVVACVVGCATKSPPVPPVAAQIAHDAGLDAPPIAAVDARALAIDARAAGKLRAPPKTATLWPTRVCSDRGVLVVDNDCGCNDAILCNVTSAIAPTLALSLRKDPSRLPTCDDCFAMVPGRCDLPALRPGPWTVQIGGAIAFDVSIDATGASPTARAGIFASPSGTSPTPTRCPWLGRCRTSSRE